MASTTTTKNPTLEQTVAVMVEKAREARKSLRPLAAKICAQLEPGDYNGEIMALYAWVCMNIRYVRDIHDVEYIQAPQRVLESKQGDCDDIACLLASLCMALGNECRFVVVGWAPNNPSHVFCQVAVQGVVGGGNGERSVDGGAVGRVEKLWTTVDPVAVENTAEMHGRVKHVQVFGI